VSEGLASSAHQHSSFAMRRIRRLKREIVLLEAMNDTLWIKAMKCAALIICGLFAVFLLCAAKFSWFGFAPIEAITLSGLVAFSCWWLGRYSKIIGLTLGFLAISIFFEDFTFDGGSTTDIKDLFKSSKIERQRFKAVAALEKRKKHLLLLEAKG
jgi:hypothetical protein